MSLRRKAVFSIALVGALLMLGLVLVDRLIISREFDQVEHDEVERDVLRVSNAIGVEANALSVLLIDWAFWDDSYEFMETRSPQYAESNLVDNLLDALSVDAFIFVDTQGRQVVSFTQGSDGVPGPIPGLEEGTQPVAGALSHIDADGEASGILWLPGTPMLVAARPILRSDGSGTPRGAMLMGRWLDEEFAGHLTDILATPTRLVPVTEAARVPGGSPGEVHVRRNGGTPTGEIVMTDMDGRPALLVQTMQQRDISRLHNRSAIRSVVMVGATTFGVTLAILAAVQWGLLRPTFRLRSELAAIGPDMRDARVTVRGNDEVAEIARDINEMLDRLAASAEEQARLTTIASQQEEVARTALLEMREGFLAFDRDGRCRVCNPTAARMLGLPAEQALERHFSDLLPPPTGAVNAPQLIEVMGRTLAVTRTDGLGARHRSVVVLRDVSDVLDIERLKRDIIQTVSHELRTPLTAIRATVDLFQTGDAGALNETQLRMVHLLSRNTDRLLHIVNDLLALSSLEGGHVTLNREEVDLTALAHRVIEDLRPAATAANVSIEVISHDPAVGWGDEPRLRQVFENVTQNAIKFSKPGGRVEIETASTPSEVTVRITDQGPGIAPEEHERVFEKFYRTESGQRVTGTGLGLPIARLLVELHGGRIWVESDGRSGTTMRFTVPTPPSSGVTTGN